MVKTYRNYINLYVFFSDNVYYAKFRIIRIGVSVHARPITVSVRIRGRRHPTVFRNIPIYFKNSIEL